MNAFLDEISYYCRCQLKESLQSQNVHVSNLDFENLVQFEETKLAKKLITLLEKQEDI